MYTGNKINHGTFDKICQGKYTICPLILINCCELHSDQPVTRFEYMCICTTVRYPGRNPPQDPVGFNRILQGPTGFCRILHRIL